MLRNAKVSCFAHGDNNTCSALNNNDCKACKFYKTKAQLASERKKSEKRISEMFGIPYKEFITIKGLKK